MSEEIAPSRSDLIALQKSMDDLTGTLKQSNSGRPGYETRVLSEPLTYRVDGEHSYFRDRVRVLDDDKDARQRLDRHAEEMRVEVPRRDAEARMLAAQNGVEFRVNPNRTPGEGGYFSPPLWLLDQFAGVPRPPRVLANLVPTFSLPAGVQSVNVPRLTTGETTTVDPDDTAESDTDITDAAVSSPVVTISGQGVIAQQLLDQSPASSGADYAFFKDLTESYDSQLETQMLYGTGTGGQFFGVTTVAGITADAYTAGTPAGVGMYTAWCELCGALADARKHHPEAFLLRTSRWMWLASQLDGAGRPLIPPMMAEVPPVPRDPGQPMAHGKIAGATRAYFDEAIATNLGSGTNQDEAIACIPNDLLLFEGTPTCTVNVDTGKSGNLQAILVFRNYAAFIAGRYPTGIATLTGTGFVVPSGF